MTSLSQAPTAAGSSAARDSVQRKSNSIASPQDRHAASTDDTAALISSSKKARRPKAQLPAKPVAVPPPEPSFDVRSILPQTKSKKSFSKLLEASSMQKRPVSQAVRFQCIDGEVRTSDTLYAVNNELPTSIAKTQRGIRGEGFEAFGIDAYPTQAKYNDICRDFIIPSRHCPLGSRCKRIHPIDRQYHLTALNESRRSHKAVDSEAASDHEHDSQPQDNARADVLDKTPNPSNAHSKSLAISDPRIRVNLPPSSFTSTIFAKALGNLPLSSNFRTMPPPRHRPTQSMPQNTSATIDDVHSWDTLVSVKDTRWNKSSSSDTSSSSNDSDDGVPSRVRTLYPWDPRAWEPQTDDSAWSDSNDTAEENQAPSRPSISRNDTNTIYATPTRTSLLPTPPPHLPPRPQISHISYNVARSPPQTPRLPPSLPAEPVHPASTPTPDAPTRKLRPRPRYTDRCRAWLGNRCTLGYDCNYVHEDLDYDDVLPEPPKSWISDSQDIRGIINPTSSTPEPSMSRRQPELYSTTIHDYIRLKFSAGFDIDDLMTGFESTWVFIGGLPRNMADIKLQGLLRPFGEVIEIKRSPNPTSAMAYKVNFSKASEAYQAFASLHGTMQFSYKLELRLAIEGKQNGTTVKDTVVRIDWECPHRCVYMGYENTELAQAAVDKAGTTLYDGFMTTAALYVGMPAVGRVTVKFHGLPVNVTEEGMNVFGAHQGMVTERPTYPYCTHEDTVAGIRKLVNQQRATLIDLEFRPPPYRDGKMRAWAYFNTPNDAKAVAENLHGRKPPFVGYNKIKARHIKTISFSLSIDKFRKVAAELKELSEKIWQQGPGYSLSTIDKNSFISLRLCGENIRVLGRLKAELERILNGEPLLDKGKIAWDDFFGRHQGIIFLQDLQRQYEGVQIERELARRTIRLFGISQNRAIVREKILEKIAQLQLQQSHAISVDGRLLAVLLDGEYQKLRKKVGSDNVLLDLWHRSLRVRGDEQVFIMASDFVNCIRKQIENDPTRQSADDECPVCFSEATSPVQLGCGHSFCRTCLQRYLRAAIDYKFFPLTCLGNEARCKERIPLALSKSLLSAGDFDLVIHAAFSAHIQSHPEEFHFCPTPDCPQVYRSAPEGVFIQCPSCLVRICPNCHSDAHDGLSCAESGEGDDLFRDWAGKHDVKQCPGCKIAIEKDDGCNHMVCTMCKTHVCWVCMKTFPNGEGIYGHMRIEHGSFGLGPII